MTYVSLQAWPGNMTAIFFLLLNIFVTFVSVCPTYSFALAHYPLYPTYQLQLVVWTTRQVGLLPQQLDEVWYYQLQQLILQLGNCPSYPQ